MTTSKRFVSWAAVSSLPQAKKVSLDEQLQTNREHAERWAGSIVEELVVGGESRSIVLFEDAARKMAAYARLKELIDARAFDVLIYLDRSRLGRKASLSMSVVELCHEAGIATYETESPPASLEPSHTYDTMLVGAIKSVAAQQDIAKLVERSRMGRLGRVKRGLHVNTPPYGYKRVYDATGAVHVIQDETETEAVRLFYDLYLNRGWAVQRIGDELSARGYISRRGHRTWQQSSLRQFLVNRWVYAGYTGFGQYSRQKNGEPVWAKAEWEPIISEETARAAEAEMERRYKARRAVTAVHRMSLVAVCDICGSTMVSNDSAYRRESGRQLGYICKQRCPGSWIRELLMVDAVRDAIYRLRTEANLEALMIETPRRYVELEEQIHSYLVQQEDLRSQRLALTRTHMRGNINDGEYGTLMTELQKEIDSLARAIGSAQHELAQTDTADNRRAYLEEIRDRGEFFLDHSDLQRSNAWLRQRFKLYIYQNDVVAVKILKV